MLNLTIKLNRTLGFIMKLAQALVLSITTAIVAAPAMANTQPTMKQVGQAAAYNSAQIAAHKAANSKQAKKLTKAQVAANAKAEKARKAAAKKRATIEKEKSKANHKVQTAKNMKKAFVG